MTNEITCFKAYDVRGRVPEQLNEDVAYRIGRAYAVFLQASKVVVGKDTRLSSDALCDALTKGLIDAGVDVYDIGLCGTEEIYFATFDQQMDGGIMVTGSHNPVDYNGMKMVRDGSKPISSDTGLLDIKEIAESENFPPVEKKGERHELNVVSRYCDHLLNYVDTSILKPYKLVVNAGNGVAGHVIDALEDRLPCQFIKIHHNPDGRFPNGVPNPLIVENRPATIDAVVENKADMGIAWDGDFDRCFVFDENGAFIEGYYIVGLLAEAFLVSHPGSKIVHDPRLTWNTIDIAHAGKGEAVQSKTGHAFMKETMRKVDAVYGGEMSAHHYFRDFAYCDSGMIPWLLIIDLMSRTGKPLSQLVLERIKKFPSSGEINRTLDDPEKSIANVKDHYQADSLNIDYTDGVSLEFDNWRFNLRQSQTEPLVRLNVESRGDIALMEEKTRDILKLLDS